MTSFTKQQQEALNTEKNLFVIANAGAGKTAVLASRFADIILKEDTGLKNIVAITFTDKAASELFNRISSILDRLVLEPEKTKLTKEQEQRLIRNRDNLISAKISTIHSFCLEILRNFPFEANLDYEFRVAEPGEINELIDDTFDKILRESKQNNTELYREFRELLLSFGSFEKFRNEIKGLYEKRYYLLQPVEETGSSSLLELFLNSDEQTIKEYYKKKSFSLFQKLYNRNLEAYICRLNELTTVLYKRFPEETEISGFAVPESYDELINLTEKLMLLIEVLGKLKLQYKNSTVPKLKKNPSLYSEDFQKTFNEIAAQFKDIFNLSDPGFDLLTTNLRKLMRVTSQILEGIELRKKAEGIADFNDVLIKTKNVLSDKTVIATLSETSRFIMIDEYQDTDNLQFEIFREIVVESIRSGQKSNLYFVGDPKQSIYMFKGANPGVFNSTVADLQNLNVSIEKVILPHSFRMTEKLALFLNYIFSKIFTCDPDSGISGLKFESEYQPVTAVERSDDFTEIEIVCIDKSPGSDKNEEKAADQIGYDENQIQEGDNEDAEEDSGINQEHLYIINKILEISSQDKGTQKVNLSQIAVLCIKNTLLDRLGELMNQYNIPYKMVKGKGFYNTQIVLDILSLCEFVLDHENNAALTAILRSPFFSLSDDQIVTLITERGSLSLYEYIMLNAESNELCSFLFRELNEITEISHSSDLEEFIRRSAAKTPYLSAVSHGLNGTQNIANFEKICDLARNHSSARGLKKSLFDFVSRLREMIKSETDESQAGVISDSEAVTLMNIHQSKGLQFDTVFVTGINSGVTSGSAGKREIIISPDLGILADLPDSEKILGEDNKKKRNLLHFLYNEIAAGRDNAEKKRLFYVAATRAKNRLYLTYTVTSNRTEGFYKFFKPVVEDLLQPSDKKQIIDEETELNKKVIILSDSLTVFDSVKNSDFVKNSETAIVFKTIKGIDEIALPSRGYFSDTDKNLRIMTENIDSLSSSEIISASQYSTFMNCPRSFYLKYILNTWRLEDFMIDSSFTVTSDRPGIDPKARGTAIHKLLERAGAIEEDKADIRQKLHEAGLQWEKEDENYIDELADSLLRFVKTDIYKEIINSPDPKREFEIYARFDDFYLHGIIDLLHINGNTAYIYDYKTDRVTGDSIKQKTAYYRKQLEFYALLVSRLNPGLTEFVLNLVFINNASEHQSVLLKKEDIISAERSIMRMVEMIRRREFPEARTSCLNCYCKNFD